MTILWVSRIYMGESHKKILSEINKDIWDYLLLRRIKITLKYLLEVLNQEADFQSWSMKAPSKLKPKAHIFSGSLQCCYVSWKRDLFSRGGDPFQVSWKHQKRYAFPSLTLIGRVLRKIRMEEAPILLKTPAC